MKIIELTKGKVTLVDDEDFELLNQWRWNAHNPYRNNWYAIRSGRREPNGHRQGVRMHRLLCAGQHVDHIDGDGLNNQRANLRAATPRQNYGNRGKNSNNSSGFKGVYWKPAAGRWVAKVAGKHIGYFLTASEAASAYDAAALIYFEQFARVNCSKLQETINTKIQRKLHYGN